MLKLKGIRHCTIHSQNIARRGSAVVIKNSISYYEEEKYETEEIQATTIMVKTKKYILTVSATYCPLRHNLKKMDYLRYLQSLGEKFIIGGDYNAKNSIF